MQDMIEAKVVEIEIDETGKLWVNIDGQCAVRVGRVKELLMSHETNGYGREKITIHGQKMILTDNYTVMTAKRGVIPASGQ